MKIPKKRPFTKHSPFWNKPIRKRPDAIHNYVLKILECQSEPITTMKLIELLKAEGKIYKSANLSSSLNYMRKIGLIDRHLISPYRALWYKIKN